MPTYGPDRLASSVTCDDPDTWTRHLLELIEQVGACPDSDRWRRRQMYVEIHDIKHALAVEFGRRHGWRLTQRAAFLPRVLARQGSRSRIGDHSFNWQFTDHTYWYKSGRAAAGVATHPYDVNDRYREEAAQWADSLGLTVAFPTDFPSWWYPGSTTLVLFTPKDPIGDSDYGHLQERQRSRR